MLMDTSGQRLINTSDVLTASLWADRYAKGGDQYKRYKDLHLAITLGARSRKNENENKVIF